MFFFGYPRIVGMQHFPNLSKLSIVNQKIGSMKGIEACMNLEELWICEGQLTRIEGDLITLIQLIYCLLDDNRAPKLSATPQAVSL